MCFGGFILQVRKEMVKYFAGMTTMATSFVEEETIQFPSFVFCHPDGFRENGQTRYLEESYNSIALNASNLITLAGVYFGTSISEEIDVVEWVLPTEFNGNCKVRLFNKIFRLPALVHDLLFKVVNLIQSYRARTVVQFSFASHMTLDLFLLVPGTEFQLQTQNFFSLQPIIKIHGQSMAALDVTKFNRKRGCEDGVTEQRFSECVMSTVERQVLDGNVSCAPFLFTKFFQSPNFRTCSNESEAKENTYKVALRSRGTIVPPSSFFIFFTGICHNKQLIIDTSGMSISLSVHFVHGPGIFDGSQQLFNQGLVRSLHLLQFWGCKDGDRIRADGRCRIRVCRRRFPRTVSGLFSLQRSRNIGREFLPLF